MLLRNWRFVIIVWERTVCPMLRSLAEPVLAGLRVYSELLRVSSGRRERTQNYFRHEWFSEKRGVVDDAHRRALAKLRGIHELRALNETGARIPAQRHQLRIFGAAQLKCFRIFVQMLNDPRCIPTARCNGDRFATSCDGCGEELRNEKARQAACFHPLA